MRDVREDAREAAELVQGAMQRGCYVAEPGAMERAERLLAQVFVVDYLPLLDQTLIYESWLRSVGFKEVESSSGPNYANHFELNLLNLWRFNDTDEWLIDDMDSFPLKTRGDVRLLCRALRVPLREEPRS